jgi:hypothetical protein
VVISLLTGVLVAVVGNAILPGGAHRPSADPGAMPTGARAGGAGNAAAPATATATAIATGGGTAVAAGSQPGAGAAAGASVAPGTSTPPGIANAAIAPSSAPSNDDRPTSAHPASASNGPARGDREHAGQAPGAEARAARSAGGASGAASESAGAVAVAPGASAAPGAAGAASPPTGEAVEPEKGGDKLAGRSTDARPEEIAEAAKDEAKETSPESATKEAARDNRSKDETPKDKTDEKLSAVDEHTPPDCSLPDKDIARESWRRNWPTLCKGAEADRVSLFIPLKGTLDGETHELRQASHEVRINLPAGESLLTLRQYKVRRSGFKDLRILPTDSGGTRLRLKLSSGTGEPSFEMKDGYAKITITAPRSASAD